MNDRIGDALDGMSARDLERMRTMIDRRLAVCILDGADGALPVRSTARVGKSKTAFTLMLCPACIEKHRRAEGRSTFDPDDHEHHVAGDPCQLCLEQKGGRYG